LTKVIIIDEFHVTVLVKQGLPETEYATIHRTLNGKQFRADLGHSVRTVVSRYPALRKVKIKVSQ
jgi:hypothetical protein